MLNKTKNYLVYAATIVALLTTAKSQENASLSESDESAIVVDSSEIKPRYGVYGSFNLDIYQADFRAFPNVPSCCPKYNGGDGLGFELGGLFDYPFNYDWQANIRVGYVYHKGTLLRNEQETIVLDGVSSLINFEHTANVSLGAIVLEPMASYRIKGKFFAHGGLSLGFLTNTTYNQIEKITKPNRGTFSDGLTFRNNNAGAIPDANFFQAGIKAGISYGLPMSKNNALSIYPEFFYKFTFTPLVKNLTWNMHTFNFGLAVKYQKPPAPPPPPPPPATPPYPALPIPQTPPPITASIDAVQLDSSGAKKDNFNIRIEDFVSLNMRPLLTYVFFDDNSSELPARYLKLKPAEVGSYKMDKLANLDALQTYYHMLNIIGKRMIDNPKAKLTITGHNSGKGEEKNNKELSKKRAETVRDYFHDVWSIDDTRLKVAGKNLPQEPTRDDEQGGIEENRRVEIESNDQAILEPVFTSDTLRMLSASTINFLPKAKSESGIKSWSLVVEQGTKQLVSHSQKGNVPAVIEWKINNKDANSPQSQGNLLYSLTVTDSLDQTVSTAKKRIPVEQLTIEKKRRSGLKDTEYEYYSLILFDFGSTKLGSEHKNVVDFVKKRVTPGAKVYVSGYTDAMGDEAINKTISTKRAKEVATRLKIPEITVQGIGEDEILYNNSLPEGRFYCRTVTITIETPIK